MAREEAFPTKVIEPTGRHRDDEDKFKHPAFGTITITTRSGGPGVLFGSDLNHNQAICLSISEAVLHRSLSRDWIHGSIHQVIEVEMSHAQFAQFITSNGNGSGTPCTITRREGVGLVPAIKRLESKSETHRREVRESTRQQLDNLLNEVRQLGEMLASGKVGIKEARALHRNLAIAVGNLPANMEFVVGQAERAITQAEYDAKIEIEAYVDSTVRRLGLNSLDELIKLGEAKTTIKSIEGDDNAGN